MNYGDETAVELFDEIEVREEGFEPEPARVIKLGKKRIQIKWDNENIKPGKTWVDPDQCELVARNG